MKYNELNLGQIEAVVNKLGGMDGVQRFLSGNAEVVVKNHVINCDADPYLPDGWKVEEHQKGGEFIWDASKVSLFLSENQKGDTIEGNKLRKELAKQPTLNAKSSTTCSPIRTSFPRNGRASTSTSGAPSTAARAATSTSGTSTGTAVRGAGSTTGLTTTGTSATLRLCVQVELRTLNIGSFRPFGICPSECPLCLPIRQRGLLF